MSVRTKPWCTETFRDLGNEEKVGKELENEVEGEIRENGIQEMKHMKLLSPFRRRIMESNLAFFPLPVLQHSDKFTHLPLCKITGI